MQQCVCKRTQHLTSNDVMSVLCLMQETFQLEAGETLFSNLITRSGKCFRPFFFFLFFPKNSVGDDKVAYSRAILILPRVR